MSWDYFISHASEDKRLVAAPLSHYLSSVGFSVWYDDFSLRVGDSILAGINDGLAESEYGVVVLSPSFFAKDWPQRELAGLIATATGRKRRVLPIWHQVDAADVARVSPLLADIKAVRTSRGLNAVAEEIVKASYPRRLRSLPVSNHSLEHAVDMVEAQATVKELLDSGGGREDIFLLLSAYQTLVSHLAGSDLIVPSARVAGPFPFDFAVVHPHGVTGPIEVIFIVLGPLDGEIDRDLLQQVDNSCGHEVAFANRPANDYLRGRYAGEFPDVLHAVRQINELVKIANIHAKRPGVWNFSILFFCGRRVPKPAHRDQGASLRIPIETASYDRLTDANVGQLRF